MLTAPLTAVSQGTAPQQEVVKLQALATTPGLFRWHLGSTLTMWHMDELNETAGLVLSEIATNAVLAVLQWQRDHPDNHVDPTITSIFREVGPDALRIEVWDHSPAQPPPPPAGNIPDIEALNGRGLFLVEQLSREWGTRPAVNGKCVWTVIES